MEDKVIGTPARPNKDLIYFLQIVLDSCNELVKKEKEIGEQLFYIYPEGYNSKKGHFADGLCALIFDSHKKVDNNKISLPIKSLQQTIDLETFFPELNFYPMSKEDDERFMNLSKQLEYSFLKDSNKKEIQERIARLLLLRKKIEKFAMPFLPIEVIEEYLDSYYRFLTYLMINEEFMRISETVKEILGLLMRIDTDDTGASLLCPMAMSAVRKMYLGIEEYYKQISENKTTDDVMNYFYQNVIIKKSQYSFRWFAYNKDGKLWHYAVSPSAEVSEMEPCLMIRGRSIENYNSFEGIGEQRIAEKILYEIKKQLKRLHEETSYNKEVEFSIAVLGDLNKKEFNSMVEYVKNVLPFYLSSIKCEDMDVRLKFNTYSKNFGNNDQHSKNVEGDIEPDISENGTEIYYRVCLDEQFSNSENVKNLIKNNHIVFMLDCIKMYQPINVNASVDIQHLKQRFAFGEALDSATLENIDLCAPNLLEIIYENMNVYYNHGFFGKLRKKANDTFLGFCQDQLRKLGSDPEFARRNHTIYVYVSDLSAFANVYCNDQYFMRTERYNQKEIGIIRFTNYNTEKVSLPRRKGEEKKQQGQITKEMDTDEHPMICFNVWQIIKHLNLEKREEIVEKIEENIKIYNLHRLYIGIDYREWPKKLNFYYGIKGFEKEKLKDSKNRYMKFLRNFTERVVIPIFNDKRNNLFQQYFWRALYSLLYGDSKDVRDMLFIHLLDKDRENMGKAVLMKEDEKKVIDYINEDYRYSIKRFYEKIMRDYDISATDSFNQQWTAHIIDKNKSLEDSSRDMFEKVMEVCVELGYEDSYLHRNCSRVLEIK